MRTALLVLTVLVAACDPIANATKTCETSFWTSVVPPHDQGEIDSACSSCCMKETKAAATGKGDLSSRKCACKKF